MRRLPSWENWRVLQIREERERWTERSFIAMHLIFTVLPDDFKGTLRNQRGLKDHLGEDPGRGIRNLDPGRDIEIKRQETEFNSTTAAPYKIGQSVAVSQAITTSGFPTINLGGGTVSEDQQLP